jgi:hypothetical protein
MYPSTNDFFAVREALSLHSNLQLQDALKACDQTQGWGVNQTLVIDQKPVFVKRIPLTEKEYAQGFNTQNLYQLPMYYHYGVGSAGFGAFRELICHQRVSDWVLQGHTAYFPLLYAYRIWPVQTPQGTKTPWRERSPEQWQQHLSYWNNNPQIAEYLSAREAAPYEIVLFLEHVPETLFAYAQQKDERAFSLLAQASEGLRFLNQRGILHLDAHLGNLLTDGERVVISDFGLALDQRFQLAPDEQRFFAQHQHYDQAGIIGSLAYIFRQYLAQAAERPLSVEQLKQALNGLKGTPDFSLPPELAGLLLKYEAPLLVVSQFFEDLRQDPSKSTRWPTDLDLPLLFAL